MMQRTSLHVICATAREASLTKCAPASHGRRCRMRSFASACVRVSAGRSHPGAIEVSALSGRVVLSGAVLEREYVRLLRTVGSVRGVADVEDRLAVYESPAGI